MRSGVNAWRATVLVCLIGAAALWFDSSRTSGLRANLGRRMGNVRRTVGSEVNRIEDVVKDHVRRFERHLPASLDRR
jgi:hypothetical protein